MPWSAGELARRELCWAGAAAGWAWGGARPDGRPAGAGAAPEALSRPHDDWTNVSAHILDRARYQLHRSPGHPLCVVRRRIERWFGRWSGAAGGGGGVPSSPVPGCPGVAPVCHSELSPVVTTAENFDAILVPSDHPSRARSDTYYLDAGTVLRTHTSAHQVPCLAAGDRGFLVSGPVFRRDTVDVTHYPVFHQMEGVWTWARADLAGGLGGADGPGGAVDEAALPAGPGRPPCRPL